MRLHALSVTAFGPFGGSVDVDFDRLGADGLFLLHGPTGAGKTSVLDAVAFALYGVLPGSRRENRRLLSDHAEAGVAPRVVLEATLGGRRVTLSRTPEYLRPKRRGDGVTKQNASASLVWEDGDGENLTRIDEVAREVERLLGMRVDQFFQVVMLPQGEFARFLRARTEDRGALLEQLFDTDRFSSVEQWFAERRRAGADALAGRTDALDRLAAQVATAAGVEHAVGDDVVDWATGLAEDARDRVVVEQARLAAARADHDAARIAAADAHRRADARRRGEAAQAALAVLSAGRADRERRAEELDAAGRAEAVIGRLTAYDAARRRADRAEEAMAAAVDTAGGTRAADIVAALSWPPSEDDAARLDAAVQDWSGEIAVLDGVAEVERHRASADRDRRTALDRVRELTETLADARARLDAVPADRLRLDAELADCIDAAAALGSAESRRAEAAAAVDARLERRRIERRLAEANETADAARRNCDELRARWLDVRERRLDSMSAELAARLTAGEPCTVCGATEHPRPAVRREDHVDLRDEREAEARKSAAEADEVSARARVEHLRETLAALGPDDAADSAALAERLDAATAEVVRLQERAVRREAVASARAALDREADKTAARITAVSAELASTRERLSALETRIAEDTARVESAIGPSASVADRRRGVEEAIDAALAVRDTRTAAAAARTAADRANADVDDAVAEAGFAGRAEAIAAARTAEARERLRADLARAEREEAAAGAALADADVAAAMADGPVDTDAVDAVDVATREALDRAVASADEAERRSRQLADLTAQLWSVADAIGPLQQRQQELEALADVVAGRGANARKMSLRSYVLAARLEEVAAAASLRFRRMSEGRFEFVHSDEAGPRGTRGGLGLDIRDDYTGVVRPAGTLSGGEAFCASLSLALGLADVVAAEAGGVTLDTMFVDEGFGTLDAESLDAVMGVLDDLRSGGRTVGIVSHVSELRDRVPSRLEVMRGRTGSTVRVHAPAI
ncbi:SMC family ATPase [Rhodococcus kroppenstedtii]|uniref:SMC family ATPase n=1 Tax=Rhodococcoides kroppenstedtii TaxID=293050 RepID=UPI00295558E2|nr:SMC family ATPase [Rhodococcus kroppenstedtii]MDV7196623.1 SMC family ATPase [Rhodococcus kroppenstedtii]